MVLAVALYISCQIQQLSDFDFVAEAMILDARRHEVTVDLDHLARMMDGPNLNMDSLRFHVDPITGEMRAVVRRGDELYLEFCRRRSHFGSDDSTLLWHVLDPVLMRDFKARLR